MIVIHCSATEENHEYYADDIRQWHKERGFKDIGYHFVIDIDGTLEIGRPLEQAGAHAQGYNEKSIAICYIGGLRKNKPADTRTEEQKTTMHSLINLIKTIYPNIRNVVGHRDLSVDLNGDGVVSPQEWMKQCPCFNVQDEF
jgi:N-acetyl-anhydromuramyl-L-alanine amidase AmpD